jgi:hypothetical protein
MSNEQQVNKRIAALEEELLMSGVALDIEVEENRVALAALKEELLMSEVALDIEVEENRAALAALEEESMLIQISYELDADDNRANLAATAIQIDSKVQKSKRPDHLTAHIEAARRDAYAPDCSSAWLAFVARANSSDPQKMPLIGGNAYEGVEYMTGEIGDDGHGIVGTLSRRAFAARYHPRPAKSRKATSKHGA